jgi:hypothetical protein
LSLKSKTWRVPGFLFPLLVSLVVGRVAPARADDGRVHLGCPQLTREQAAEVEARVRVALLGAAAPDARVTITCEPESALVVVTAEQDRAERPVVLGPGDVRERLLSEVDAALQQLARPVSTGAPPAPSPTPPRAAADLPSLPQAPVLPTLPSGPPAEQLAPNAGRATSNEQRRARAELSARAGGEVWRDKVALGAALGLGYGWRSLSLNLHIRGNTLPATGSNFSVQEWSAAVGLAWTPGWAWGLRGELELGPSLLNVTPRGQLSPRGSTAVAAWYSAVSISRPLWLGRAAVVPGVGARAFTDVRRINVDGDAKVILGRLVPSLTLGLLYLLN